jgi:hypothetical protein
MSYFSNPYSQKPQILQGLMSLGLDGATLMALIKQMSGGKSDGQTPMAEPQMGPNMPMNQLQGPQFAPAQQSKLGGAAGGAMSGAATGTAIAPGIGTAIGAAGGALLGGLGAPKQPQPLPQLHGPDTSGMGGIDPKILAYLRTMLAQKQGGGFMG